MKGSLLIAVALFLALTIFLSFVHPATSVLVSRQAKLIGLLQLVALAVFALVAPVFVIHSRISNTWLCAADPAGAARVTFICSFLC
jgi:antibiotic biosynthesis monooxygenase (ABM) superfamily enzyme